MTTSEKNRKELRAHLKHSGFFPNGIGRIAIKEIETEGVMERLYCLKTYLTYIWITDWRHRWALYSFI